MSPLFKNIVALSIVPQVIIVKWLGNYPALVEKYYAEGIYPYIAKFLRILFGWIPFSIGDLFYTILVFAIIRYLYLHARSIRKKPVEVLQHLGITIAIAYFIFHLFWGMNYYRLPIEEKFDIQRVYTVDELEQFTKTIILKTNYWQKSITQDSTVAVQIPYTRKEIFEKTAVNYATFKGKLDFLNYQSPSIKKSLYSLALTYMGYGGYLNPFTNEAQVNGKLPLTRFPTVSGHEIGHQLGYSAEDATNFIGFLSTSTNDDPYFKYATYAHVLAYCLSDLKPKNEERFEALWKTVNPGVKKNYQELAEFWKRYENPTEPIFKAAFNAFLKANNQEEGILSYNSVVGLLINYDKKYGF